MTHLSMQQLSESIDDVLDWATREVVRRHLRVCSECAARRRRIQHVDETLAQILSYDPGDAWLAAAGAEIVERIQSGIEGRPLSPNRVAGAPAWYALPASPGVTAFAVGSADAAADARPAPAPVDPAGEVKPPWTEPQRAGVAMPSVPAPVPVAGHSSSGSGVHAGAIAGGLAVVAGLAVILVLGITRQPRTPETLQAHAPTVAEQGGAPKPGAGPGFEAGAPESARATSPLEDPSNHEAHPLQDAADRPAGPPARTAAVADARPRTISEPVRASAPMSSTGRVKVHPAAEPPSAPPASRPVAAPQTLPIARRDRAPDTLPSPAASSVHPTPSAAEALPPAGAADEDWPLLCGAIADPTGEPVQGAIVSLEGVDLNVRTDRRGRFCVSAPSGARAMSVVAQGFVTHQATVTLRDGADDLRVTLSPAR